MRQKNRPTNAKRSASKAIVLLSGGIDSTACLAHYRDQGFRVEAVFINYGQLAAKKELRAAKSVCRQFQVPLRIVRLTGATRKGAGLVVGRNAFLLTTAALEFGAEKGIIALGIHSGTRYRDCSPQFVRRMQAVFDACVGGRVQIGVPFLRWKKGDIWTFAKAKNVPLRLTYSCERGLAQPCGSCDSCSDLEALHAGSQHQD
jgi:7-cyano-7-deazaguanine synthase